MLTARDESLLGFPLWDLDAVAIERRDVDARRAPVCIRLEQARDALRRDGWASEVKREAEAEIRASSRVLDHLDAVARELRGRAARH